MLRVTQAVGEVRAWAEARGGWPCRQPDGRLALGFPRERCRGVQVGWGEFQANFRVGRYALAYDDGLGSTCCLVGSAEEAAAFAAGRGRRALG